MAWAAIPRVYQAIIIYTVKPAHVVTSIE
jgi:hypothetical protein